MKPGCLVLAVLAAVLVAAGVFAGVAASQAVFNPAPIAFVDVGRIFKDYQKAAAIQTQVQEEIRAINKALAARVEELKRRRSELELLLPGTPEFRLKQGELDREAFAIEWDEKDQKGTLERSLIQRMSQVYTEIRNEAENFALRNKLGAVFMVNTHDMQARSQEELQVLIASRPVVHWDRALDITEQILAVMNEDRSEQPPK